MLTPSRIRHVFSTGALALIGLLRATLPGAAELVCCEVPLYVEPLIALKHGVDRAADQLCIQVHKTRKAITAACHDSVKRCLPITTSVDSFLYLGCFK